MSCGVSNVKSSELSKKSSGFLSTETSAFASIEPFGGVSYQATVSASRGTYTRRSR